MPPADPAITRRIDELHLDDAFTGSRMLRDLFGGESAAIGRRRVATMSAMGRVGTDVAPSSELAKSGSLQHRIGVALLFC